MRKYCYYSLVLLNFVQLFLMVSPYIQNTRFQVVEFGGMKGVTNESSLLEYLNIPPYENYVEIFHEDPLEGTVQLMIRKDLKDRILARATSGFTYNVVVEDVNALIASFQLTRRNDVQELFGQPTFDRYMTYEEIMDYLTNLQRRHPTRCRLEIVGRSVDGRDIPLLVISNKIRVHSTKPVIFLESGIHAREWISPAATIFVIEQLLSTPYLIAEMEWRIMPLTNPDGYEYSWSDGPSTGGLLSTMMFFGNRLWRKNRGDYPICEGVDLNRNFAANWETLIGSSIWPCSQTFRGDNPFSEPETQTIRNQVLKIRRRLKAYLSIHSYGQIILYPPGLWRTCVPKEKLDATSNLGERIAEEIENHQNVRYRHGITSRTLYPVSGGSTDWVFHETGIHRTFTIELRDRGSYGFMLPPSEIRNTGRDLFVAVQVVADDVYRSRKEFRHNLC